MGETPNARKERKDDISKYFEKIGPVEDAVQHITRQTTYDTQSDKESLHPTELEILCELVAAVPYGLHHNKLLRRINNSFTRLGLETLSPRTLDLQLQNLYRLGYVDKRPAEGGSREPYRVTDFGHFRVLREAREDPRVSATERFRDEKGRDIFVKKTNEKEIFIASGPF